MGKVGAILAVLVLALGTSGAAGSTPAAQSWIAFMGGKSFSKLGLWIVRPDGTGLRSLTRGKPDVDIESVPTWSPDHRWVAFAAGNPGIFVADLDSRTVRHVVSEGGTVLFEPSWNPKSNVLAVTRSWGTGLAQKSALALVGASGTIRSFPAYPGSYDGTDFDSSWSPDGRRVAFSRRSGKSASLYLVDSSGRGLKHLTMHQSRREYAFDDQAAWSPTGSVIAFTRITEPVLKRTFSIYTIRPDGTGLRLLIKNAYGPAWSPDGKQLAFVRSEVHAGLGIADANGGHQRRVTVRPSSFSIGFGLAWCC